MAGDRAMTFKRIKRTHTHSFSPLYDEQNRQTCAMFIQKRSSHSSHSSSQENAQNSLLGSRTSNGALNDGASDGSALNDAQNDVQSKHPQNNSLLNSVQSGSLSNISRNVQDRLQTSYQSSLAQQRLPILTPKLLLHVLAHNESRDDLIKRPKSIAFRGQTDVYIARAELELRKAIQSLALISNIDANSLHTLAALSLPGSVTATLWTSSAFVQTRHQNLDDQGLIRHRNHDARLLFQQIARLDLQPWADQLINQVKLEELPEGIFMPPGHPIPGETYRRHPFQQRQNFYYPVSQFFSMIFEERQQALTALLGELGATKIIISSPPGESFCDGGSSPIAQLYEQSFEYPESVDPLPSTIDIQRHPWLSCEPKWQAVVRERLNRGILSAQFEFGLDIVGILRKQIHSIDQLVPQLDSMTISARNKTELLLQTLQPRRVQVEFSRVETTR